MVPMRIRARLSERNDTGPSPAWAVIARKSVVPSWDVQAAHHSEPKKPTLPSLRGSPATVSAAAQSPSFFVVDKRGNGQHRSWVRADLGSWIPILTNAINRATNEAHAVAMAPARKRPSAICPRHAVI